MNHKIGIKRASIVILSLFIVILGFLFVRSVFAQQYFLDAQDEYFLGLSQDKQLMEKYKIYDAKRFQRIHKIAKKLMCVSEKRKSIDYSFYLVENSPLGSCSIAGGFVYIDTADMEMISGNDDELAFIIAHEMAHIDHRDGANNLELLTAFRDKESVYQRSFDIKLKNLVYNRQQEYSADAFATLCIYKCGYNPDVGIRLMKKFRASIGEYRPGMEKFKGHPSFSHRMENMEQYIRKIKIIESKFQDGVNALRYKDYDSAIVNFREYQTMFYDSREVYNNLGWAYFGKGMKNSNIQGEWHYGGGIAPLVKRPEDSLILRGVEEKLNIDLISFENAIDCYKKAQSIDRVYELPFNNLAILYVQIGNEADALTTLEELKRLNPCYALQYNTLGIISARKNDLTKAISYFIQSQELSPDYTPSLFNLALCYEKTKDFESAKKRYHEFLTKDATPKNEWHKIATQKLVELR